MAGLSPVPVMPCPNVMPDATPPRSDPQQTSITLLLRINGEGRSRELAWEEFDALYRPRISAFARRVGAAAGEAEDLVQEVLAGFFRVNGGGGKPFEYDGAGSLRGYLFVATRNALLKLRKRQGRQPRTGARGDAGRMLADRVACEQAWNDVWELEQLQQAVDRVRRHYQQTHGADLRTFLAFYRSTFDERDTADVAAELGMEEESVRQAKSRITGKLREELAFLKHEEG